MADITIRLQGIDAASGVIEGVTGAIGGLGSLAAGALTAGFAAATAGAVALGGGLVFSIGQALEGEQIMTRLESVIRSTGGAAGLTADEAQTLANKFMNLAGGTDDTVLAIIEMGLRMGTVSEEMMPQFIQTTLDMAAATGTDAVNAARLLAQAQEDPISALTRFRRMGILFTEAQEEQIKTLMEAGDVAGAQAIIMERLGEATAGAAAAGAETIAGQFEVLKGNLGEAAETIGAAFLPVLHELFDSVIAPAIPLIEEFASALGAFFSILLEGDIGGAIGVFGEFDGVRAILQGLGVDIYAVGGAVEDFVETAQAQFAAFMVAVQPVIDAAMNVAAAFVESMPMIQAFVGDMVNFVIGQFNLMAPTLITNVTSTLNSLAEFWTEHGDTIMAVVNFAFRTITVTIGGTLTLISGLVASIMAAINGDWTGAWQAIVNTLTTFMNMALSIVGTNLEEFTASWRGTFELAKIIWNTFWSNFVTTWTNNWEMAKTIVTTIWGQIVDGVQALVARFTEIGRAIIDGMISGIQSAVGGLVSAAVGAVGDAIAAAKALLGISSPSLVFAGIGANMMAGMAQGIQANAGLPARATASAAMQSTAYATNFGGVSFNLYGDPRGNADAVMARLDELGRNADGYDRMR